MSRIIRSAASPFTSRSRAARKISARSALSPASLNRLSILAVRLAIASVSMD